MSSKRKCKTCKEYFPKEDGIDGGISFYCSEQCMFGEYKKVNRHKVNKTPMPEGRRDEILALDRYKCRFCGKVKPHLYVHHINYKSKTVDHSKANLVTLCEIHHRYVHGNKHKYQPLCKEIVFLRQEQNYVTIEMLEKRGNLEMPVL